MTVSIGYDAAATTIVLTSGEAAAAGLPTTAANYSWWNASDYGTPDLDPHWEIIRCTRSVDTLTCTRAAEAANGVTTAFAHNTVGKTYKMLATLTAKTLNTDVLAAVPDGDVALGVETYANARDITLADGGNKDPYWLSADRSTLFGGGTNTLTKSINDGTTWTTVHAGFSSSIMGVRDLANGELLVSLAASGGTPGSLYLSSGYPQAGDTIASITWTKVLDAGAGGVGPSSHFPGSWGMSTGPNGLIFVSEYGLQNPPTDSARFVYRSTDYGVTWTLVFDLGTVATSHLHAVAYDPWWDAVWLTNGDGAANKQVRVSWDRGATWNIVAGANTTQYVSILPMRDCILFLTDGAPNGVHRISRASGRGTLTMETAATLNSSVLQTHVGGMPFIAQGADAIAILPFFTAMAGQSGYVLTTYDGYRFQMPWQDPTTYTVKGPQVIVGPTTTGLLTGYQTDGRQANASRISWAGPGVPAHLGIVAARTTAINAALAALSPLGSNLANGAFYVTTPASSRTASTRTAGNMTLIPIYISRPCILDRIGVETTIAGAAGSLVRLGVYASDSVSGLPTTLLLDAGTVDGAAVAGFQEATIALTISTPGVYWLAGVVQVSSPTLRLCQTSNAFNLPHATALTLTAGGVLAYLQTGVTGALPNPFVYGGSNSLPMVVAVRVKA